MANISYAPWMVDGPAATAAVRRRPLFEYSVLRIWQSSVNRCLSSGGLPRCPGYSQSKSSPSNSKEKRKKMRVEFKDQTKHLIKCFNISFFVTGLSVFTDALLSSNTSIINLLLVFSSHCRITFWPFCQNCVYRCVILYYHRMIKYCSIESKSTKKLTM